MGGHLAGREAASQSEPLVSRPDVADPACEPSLLAWVCAFSCFTVPDNLKHRQLVSPSGVFHQTSTGPDSKPAIHRSDHALSLARHLPSPTTNPHPVAVPSSAEHRITNPRAAPRRSSPRPPPPPAPAPAPRRCDLRFSARPQGKLVSPPATTHPEPQPQLDDTRLTSPYHDRDHDRDRPPWRSSQPRPSSPPSASSTSPWATSS